LVPAEPGEPAPAGTVVPAVPAAPVAPVAPVTPSVPFEPPLIGIIDPEASIIKADVIILICLYKYVGNAVIFGLVGPPPCPPARYVILLFVVEPLTVPSETAEDGSPIVPLDTEPMPMWPSSVNVSLTKTLYPLVKRMPALVMLSVL
jgi:hypothetical protein